jgi:hypothetical protein
VFVDRVRLLVRGHWPEHVRKGQKLGVSNVTRLTIAENFSLADYEIDDNR